MEQRATLSFGAALKRHRRLARLTQEQLAERAGYSVSYISMLERGERVPVRATVELLAEALGLTAAEQSAFELAAREHSAVGALPDPPRFPHLVISAPPLAGRAAEIQRIDHFLIDEDLPLLLLVGEPGIGKSRLLAEVRMRAEAVGWATLTGAAQRSGSHLPYTPILEAIERHATNLSSDSLHRALADAPWLVRLLPELAESAPPQTHWALPPEQERRLIFTAVARYLTHLGGASGTLLILDDLQWAGADALDLLAALLRAPLTDRLRVIAAYRESEVNLTSRLAALLADVAASGRVRRLVLGPLAPTDAALLVREVLPADGGYDETVERIVSRSGGIPFYLVSFAQSLSEADSDADAPADQVPWDIAQTIRQRIATLSAASRELLEIAAVVGRNVQRVMLFAASRDITGEDALVVALDATCRMHLLIEHGDGYAFAHELLREVMLLEIGQARRALLHLRIAEALEGIGGEKPIEQIAYHFAHGGSIERAIPYLAQSAARASAMRAYASAESHYRELADLWDQLAHHHEAAAAREQLGEVLTIAGHFDDAIDTLESAAQVFQSSEDWTASDRAVALIGLAYAAKGDAISGIARLEPLTIAERAEAASPRERAELWDALAQLYNVGGRYADQLSATVRAADLAKATGDASLQVRIQMRHGSALRMLGRMREATTILEEAIHIATTTNDEQNLAFALENVSVVYLLQGKLKQNKAYVQRALELSQRQGDPIVLALMTLRRGMSAYALGSWDEAQADYQSAEARMREVGVAWVSAYTLIGLGQLYLARGESESGSRLLAEAVELSTRSGDLQALRWAQTALAEWDILVGRPESARQRLEPLLDRPGLQEGLVTYLLPYLAWACAETHDTESAQSYLRECVARAEVEDIHLALVDALRVDGILALQSRGEQRANAESGLERAIELCHAMPYPYVEAKVRYTLGLYFRVQGRVDAAENEWHMASTILNQLGERLYANRIEAAQASISQ